MLKELFDEQRRNVNTFFDEVDLSKAQIFADLLAKCQGMIFLAGVGKSGFVAQKIATTLTSINIKALALSVIDALHGDLGIVSKNDLFILLSRSGETEELLTLLPFVRNKGAKIILLTCESNSRLGKGADYEIVLPIEKEICPFNLMPTTSSAVMMIFGDIIATYLMKIKEMKIDDYRLNHPAGRIGKRLTMRVKDIMMTGDRVPVCRPDDQVIDILVELSNKQCGCMVVTGSQGEVQGIFTDGDLRRAILAHQDKALFLKMKEVMTKTPRTTNSDRLAFDAMQEMESNQKTPITVLPVVDKERLIGLIKMHDIIQSGV